MNNSDTVDWEAQWAAHSPGYRDGYLHVDLKDFGCAGLQELKLLPGPGFGDLSHPTTNLVMHAMAPLVRGRHVLDVGCGSGILSFAAAAMGAASVCGIDIEADALQHSRRNSSLNGMESKMRFMLPEEYLKTARQKPLIVLMNMISSEQNVAWQSLMPIHGDVSDAVTSGILVEDRADYLRMIRQWGWTLRTERIDGAWAGFVFHVAPKSL